MKPLTDLYIDRSGDKVYRRYKDLACDDDAFIRWLDARGFSIEHVRGTEFHDIGDSDYFVGCIAPKSAEEVIRFLHQFYGNWDLDARRGEIPVFIANYFPNDAFGATFHYPEAAEDALADAFERFHAECCHPDMIIKERTA